MQMWLCVGVSHTLRAAASLTVDVRSQQLSSQQAMRKSLVSSWQMCSKKKHTRMFSQRTEQAWSPDSPCCDNKDMTHVLLQPAGRCVWQVWLTCHCQPVDSSDWLTELSRRCGAESLPLCRMVQCGTAFAREEQETLLTSLYFRC